MAKPLVMGRKEIAKVYGIAPTAVSDRWVPGGVLSYEDAVIVSGKPYWPGGLVIDLALPPGSRGRQLDQGLLEKLIEEQGSTSKPMKAAELPPLVGAQEYAELFGVSQVKVSQAARTSARGQLPVADYSLSGSSLWLLDTVLAGAEHTVRVSAEARRSPGEWKLNESVAEQLRAGTYEGPGSSFKARGKKAVAEDSEA